MSTRPNRADDPDDLPDPALFWRWVGRATRPVIGWVLVLIGAVMILLGYHGVSHEVLVAKQLPYLISGGILGIAVVAVGVLFIGTEEIRRDSGRLDRLERMVGELHAVLLSRSDAPESASEDAVSESARLVALPEGERYHAETCRVVAGKPAAAPVDLRDIQERGLTPCPLCEPIAVGNQRCNADSRSFVFWVQITITGVAVGSIYALAGLGLVLTYKATGVFNFAHGAIAMIVAYSLWEARERWDFPLWLAGIFALLIVGPGIGLLLERLIFRRLQVRGASTSEKLVATLGVFLACEGLAYKVWTGTVRQEPRLITNKALHLPGSLIIGTDQLATVILVILVSAGLWAMFRFTPIGTDIKAVVDRRELAELSSINANRVAGLSWALGCGLAGVTGVLLAAQEGLDPYHLTLLVIETFSIAVVAGLTSLPIAIIAGIGILGVGNALLLQFNPHVVPLVHWHLPATIRNAVDQLKPNLSVVVLFIALVVLRNLDEPSEDRAGRSSLISKTIGRVGEHRRLSTALMALVLAAAAVLPFGLNLVNISRAQIMLGLLVVFVSIVCITGLCGYISLGQAGFAGFGAFVAARAAVWWHLTVPIATAVGGLGALVLGVVAGYPALRRRGLFLGLTTLSVGLLAYNVLFTNDFFRPSAVATNRPDWAIGNRAFYWYELIWVVLMLLLARNLSSGRLGRVLGAMGDSEVAAQSVGINLRRYKLLVFGVSAFIAGVGGSLLAQQAQVFSGDSFDPITSLQWFAVVIIAGVGTLDGAVVAAILFEALDIFFPGKNLSQLFLAGGALFIGYIPGGSVTGAARKAIEYLRHPTAGQRRYREARRETLAPPPAPLGTGYVPSPFAVRISEDVEG